MAEYTIDYNRGSDSNDGITAPWKNLSKLDGTFASGDVVILDDESTWDVTGRVVVGTIGTNFTVRRSATNGSQKPTISFKFSVAAGSWTYDAPNNGWYYDIGYTPGVMSWIRLAGAHYAERQEAALPLVSRDLTWKNSSNRVYVYAPADIDPTTYYGSVEIGPSDRGAITFSSDGSNVLIDGIRSEESGTLFLIYANSGNRLYTLRNCETYDTTMLIFGNADTAGATRYIVEDGNFERAVTAFVQFYCPSGLGQGVSIVRRNRMRTCNLAYPQGAIYMQTLAGVLIYDNDIIDARYGTYHHQADGCAIYAEVGSDNFVAWGNRITDTYLAFQDNSGRRATFMGNLLYNVYSAMKVSDASAVGNTDHRFYGNTCMVGAEISPQGPRPTAATGWRAYKPSGAAMTLAVHNNIIVDERGASESYGAAILTPQVTYTGAFTHNCLVGFPADGAAEFGGATPTVTNSINSDPLLDASYRPLAGSPCLDAGIYIPGARDYAGRKLKRVPDIGARQYYAPLGVVSPLREAVATPRTAVSTPRRATFNRRSRG